MAAAAEGAERIVDSQARAELCDHRAVLAVEMDRPAVAVSARQQAWRSSPVQPRLQLLLTEAAPDQTVLVSRVTAERAWAESDDIKLSGSLQGFIDLLAGDYFAALKLLQQAPFLGWGSGAHPGPVVFPGLLVTASSPAPIPRDTVLGGMLQRIDVGDKHRCHQDIAGLTSRDPDCASGAPHRSDAGATRPCSSELLMRATHQHPISESERVQLLQGTEEIAQKRTKAIVSCQHQGAYDRAARLLVAVAETWCLVGEAAKASAPLIWARKQFPRHSAFKRALTAAAADSQLLRGSDR